MIEKIYNEKIPRYIASDDKGTFANIELKVTIWNSTEKRLSLTWKDLPWGTWKTQPANSIAPKEMDSFVTQGETFSGPEGYAEYSLTGASFTVHWSVSFWGVTDNYVSVKDPEGLYNITLYYDDSEHEVTVYVKQK